MHMNYWRFCIIRRPGQTVVLACNLR